MAPILYYSPSSGPCQLVLLIAKHLNLELDLTLGSAEILKSPEFLKINPSHTYPTLVDNDLNLPESRAIAIYLLEKYGKDDPLVPKDIKKRALVNHRLFFDLGVLNLRALNIAKGLVLENRIPTSEEFKQLEEALGFLNSFLDGQKWLVGDSITVADYAVLISVSIAEAIPLVVLNKFPNVADWFHLTKKTVVGYHEIVATNMKSLQKTLMEKFLSVKENKSS